MSNASGKIASIVKIAVQTFVNDEILRNDQSILYRVVEFTGSSTYYFYGHNFIINDFCLLLATYYSICRISRVFIWQYLTGWRGR